MRLLSFLLALSLSWALCGAEIERIDLNNAPKQAIETLPGIGPKLADEIIAGRPYRTFSDLDKVKGIGPKKLDQLRGRVMIVPPRRPGALVATPATNQPVKIDLNKASQSDLEKLPGIGPKRAEAIIAARPFRKPEDLMKIDGIKRAQFEKLKDQVVVR